MRCALAPRVDLGARALVSGPPHSPLRRASQAIEEATGKIYNGKGKDGKKIDKGAAAARKLHSHDLRPVTHWRRPLGRMREKNRDQLVPLHGRSPHEAVALDVLQECCEIQGTELRTA